MTRSTLAGALVAVLLLPPLALAQAVCTHWASPQGTGATCTPASAPCLIGTFLSNAAIPKAGAVLCMLDGVYTGEASMLTLTSVSGTATQPLTIRAMNDGQVEVNGQFGMRPGDCAASYLTVQGINFRDGNDTTLAIRGQHCTMQRVVAWSTQAESGIENVIDIGGSNNLLEDCGAFGYARKMIAMGARGGPGPNTVRRCWVEHNGSMPGSAGGNPTNPVEIGYDQFNGALENVIARRNILSSATDPMAPLMMFSTRNAAILGSIAYVVPGDNFDTNVLAQAIPEWGSHIGVGNATSDSLIQDLVVYAAPVFTHVNGFSFTGSLGTGNRADRIVAVAPQGGGECSGTSWTCSNVHKGQTLEAALGGKKIYEVAPGVCKRYVNRQLTDIPLWPFPMEARIEAALARARMPTRNVTRHVERAFGTIPALCRSDTPPPEPEPTPPGPHAPLVCTGTVAAVPGQVAMRCVPEAVRR